MFLFQDTHVAANIADGEMDEEPYITHVDAGTPSVRHANSCY